MGAVFETAKILYQTGGLRALAMLSFCHVGYVNQQDAKYVGVPAFEKVVASREQLPEGAIVTKELKDGEFADNDLARNEGEDWIAGLHTGDTLQGFSGNWPMRYEIIPDSAHLTREQANKKAKALSKGK